MLLKKRSLTKNKKNLIFYYSSVIGSFKYSESATLFPERMRYKEL